MYVYKIIILCGLLLGSAGLKAQEAQCSIDRELRADSTNRNRIITRATMYGIGFTNVFDTYLSPQEYKGIDFRISRESMRMTRLMGGNVSLQTFFQADLGYTHNKVDNNNTFSGLANWNYGLHYNFQSRAISNCLPEESATSTVALSIICATETTPPKHVPISTLPHREWLFGTYASRTVPSHYAIR